MLLRPGTTVVALDAHALEYMDGTGFHAQYLLVAVGARGRYVQQNMGVPPLQVHEHSVVLLNLGGVND